MNSLIIGKGEIGKALLRILKEFYLVEIIDKKEKADGKFEILHICFPFSEKFVSEVKRYQKEYSSKHTVIHSTVPIGVSKKCKAVHSPIIGIHPFLEEGIKTFVKYLGGKKASNVADYFRKAGIKVYLFDKSETTELMKVLSTTFYSLMIEYTKDVKRLCEVYGAPFEAWTLWTDNYNEGYKKLGYPEFARPNLIPIKKKLGGHCLIPNLEFINSEFTRFIKKLNQ